MNRVKRREACMVDYVSWWEKNKESETFRYSDEEGMKDKGLLRLVSKPINNSQEITEFTLQDAMLLSVTRIPEHINLEEEQFQFIGSTMTTSCQIRMLNQRLVINAVFAVTPRYNNDFDDYD